MLLGRIVSAMFRLMVAALGLIVLGQAPLSAQSTTIFTQSNTGSINGNTICNAPLVRNINVSNSFTVGDVDLGVLVTHSWRGDLQITLQGPDGTRVQLTDGDTQSVSGDNLNVLFDDSASEVVNTDSATGNHSTTAPPFQNTFSPRNPLSAFSGKASAGTWRLEICDLFPSQDNGSFRYAELRLTSAPSTYADLSLSKTLVGTAPSSGGSATFRLTVTNASYSTSPANSVAVRDYIPPGFTVTSSSGTGSFNPSTGAWTVGTVPIGQSRSIDITGTVSASAGATVTNTAEITASSVADIDSTMNNGVTTEDDHASASLTVTGNRVAGNPPALSCPAGNTLFDWDPLTWAAGSTSNSYALASYGNVQFNLANPGTWLNNAGLGGQSPNLQTVLNGGFTGQKALIELVDLPSRSSRVTTTVTLPSAMPGAQFRLFDIDAAANQFADLVVVEGRYQGTTVTPTLTNGVSNYVIGNSAYGDGASNSDSANGNVVVTFNSPIDTIVLLYGNHSDAPLDPGQQGIGIGDITFCNPTTVLSVSKTSAVVSDPANGTNNPKMIPGAIVEYCIVISNPGGAAATSVLGSDALPSTETFVTGSIRSGTSCPNATTIEDDNSTGPDESDPFGASYSGTTVTGTAATLGAGQTFAMKFRATIN